MAASEQSSSLNVALADGQLSGNRDDRFGSIEASQAGCDSPGNRMRLPSQPTERTDTGWAAHRRPRLIDFRQANFVSPLALGLVHGTVGTAEDGLAI